MNKDVAKEPPWFVSQPEKDRMIVHVTLNAARRSRGFDDLRQATQPVFVQPLNPALVADGESAFDNRNVWKLGARNVPPSPSNIQHCRSAQRSLFEFQDLQWGIAIPLVSISVCLFRPHAAARECSASAAWVGWTY